MTERKLSETQIICLRWMVKVNAGNNGIGLFGPTVHKSGPMEELAGLVDGGYCKLVHGYRGTGHGRRDGVGGYWITENGRSALAEALSS